MWKTKAVVAQKIEFWESFSRLLFNKESVFFSSLEWRQKAQCLKLTEKVSFNIASEASYIYVLNGEKLIKIAKNLILVSFRKPETCGQIVLPDRSVLNRQKSFKMSKLEILNATFWVFFGPDFLPKWLILSRFLLHVLNYFELWNFV